MKRILAISIALGAAFVAYSAANPTAARCDYCTPAPCFSASQCNAGCVCMKPNDFTPGTCTSFK